MKTARDLLKLCHEGTWAFPQTRQQIDKLVAVFKANRNGLIDTTALSGLVGDDDLFDELTDVMREYPKSDGKVPVSAVAHWVVDMADDHDRDPEILVKPWSKEDKEYARKSLQPFLNIKWKGER